MYTRPESKFRGNLQSRNSLEKLTIDHSKDKQIHNNTFNIKKEAKSSLTDRIVSNNLAKATISSIYSPKTGNLNVNGNNIKQNFSKINNQFNSITNNKYVINQKTKSDTISTITNEFVVHKKGTDNFNRNSESQNNIKTLRGTKKIITRGIKSITTFPFSNSNVGISSSTPIKQALEINHKNTKSNFLMGEGLTNLNNIFAKESNIARKIQDSKIIGTKGVSNGNTPNDVTKKITKIKNFYEVVKNANLNLNSNSERVSGSHSTNTNIYSNINSNCNSKPELFMNQNKIQKNKFK